MNVAQPSFFGNFMRSPGSPSDDPTVMRTDGGCTDGCLGIRMGGGGIKAAMTTEMEENKDDPTILIANAMSNLTLQEREQAYEDLHGVAATVHETPELIDETLNQMEHCLQKIHRKAGYDLAMSILPEYVQDSKLRLMFLRAERFNADLAAKRFVNNLDWKLKLFGKEKLCQSYIGLDDLDKDARAMVDTGLYQVLPARDSRGRVIVAAGASHLNRLHRSNQSTLQMAYYILLSLAEDEINQKLGMVCICYGLGQTESDMSSENIISIQDLADQAHSMPIRIEATQYLARPSGMQHVLNLVAKSYVFVHRARLRVHFGTHVECTYAILSFGLPSSSLPFTDEGELKTDNHKKWIKRRIVKEQELHRFGVFTGIDLPSRNDVLLGQGKPIQHHPGNQRLRDLCEIYLDEYNEADRQSKTLVAAKIMRLILHPSDPLGRTGHGGVGGRFLKRKDCKSKSGWWVEEKDEDALIDKVCNTFRTIRKQKRYYG
jgi:hypothetical protein